MDSTAPQAAERFRGILLMLAAVGVFAVMDALMKQLAGHYPPLQVACLRGASSLPFLLAPVLLTGRWRSLIPVRLGLHLLRAVMAILMLWGFIFALSRAGMADTYALFMCAPLLVVLVAAVALGERVGRPQWLAIAAGLAGTWIILRPTAAGMVSLAGLAAVGAALAYAIQVVAVRVLARTDSTSSMVFWFLLLLALGAGALAAPSWVAVRAADWTWIALVGLTGWAGQYLITEAFRLAPATVIAPYEYTALLWAVGIDWLVWQVIPSQAMLAGSAVLVAAGLYLLHIENRPAGRLNG